MTKTHDLDGHPAKRLSVNQGIHPGPQDNDDLVRTFDPATGIAHCVFRILHVRNAGTSSWPHTLQ